MNIQNLPRDATIISDDILADNITITLNPSSTMEVPDYIYDALLNRFRMKAMRMGYNMANVNFENWTISAELTEE